MRLALGMLCDTLDDMKILLALHLLFSSYVHANIQLPFHPEADALCFRNADPDLAKVGIPILGKFGVNEGVCQGIAGVTAAFLENAQFEPSMQFLESSEKIIHQLVESHRRGLRVKTIVPGSKNIREFCDKNKREFMREAILYNADLATRKILPHISLLFTLKKNHLRGPEDQSMLMNHLRSLEETLLNGRYPLMLYFKHVVMVTSFKEKISDSGERWIELETYDSNLPEAMVVHLFKLNLDGLPALANYMVWNIGI